MGLCKSVTVFWTAGLLLLLAACGSLDVLDGQGGSFMRGDPSSDSSDSV